MPLKIICLEEHLIDPALAKAVQPAMLRHAPYLVDVDQPFRENPDGPGGNLSAPFPMDRASKLGQAPAGERLAAMDAHGIDMHVLSYSNPTQAAPPDEAVDLARAANDQLAALVAAQPGRFAGFSTLPWQNPDAALRELERSARDLGLRGTLLMGHPGEDALLDDPRYAPILAKLEELAVPIYIHPGVPLPAVQRPYYGGLDKQVSARLSLFGWGWHNEAGIQVIRLILSGALDRHPKLHIISGHWGEMVPFFLDRMDDSLPQAATGLSRTISQTYRDQVTVTPSGMFTLPHFQFIHALLGAERIMFSIDYPYLSMQGARAWLEALPISEAERGAIAHGNAERLLRLGG